MLSQSTFLKSQRKFRFMPPLQRKRALKRWARGCKKLRLVKLVYRQRTILLLGLFADIFSSTDKQHAVTTPASLYIGNVLSHCAVRSTNDANCAVILCALASAYVVPAMRIFPEALNLLTALIHASGESEKCKQTWNEGLPTHLQEQCGGSWLRPLMVDAGVGKKSSSKTIEVLSLAKLFRPRRENKSSGRISCPGTRGNASICDFDARKSHQTRQKVACAPEMLQKVQVALNRLMRSLKTFGKKAVRCTAAF